jgi:hypothetical protein
VDEIPDERDARLAFLEGWAVEQQRRLYAEEIARVVGQARQRIAQVDSLREAAVIPVVITKPSDLPVDRAAVFADLMVGLREYKWVDPIVSECDEPRHVAPKAIELARRRQPGAAWLLYMQDDVILGPDFGLLPGLLTEADELFPNAGIVSFFSGEFREPGWSLHPMRRFGWLQCAAIRNTDYLETFWASIAQRAGEHVTPSSDFAVALFLRAEYDEFALWCPSLVQHAEVTSTLSNPPGRISWSYKQAYG